MKKNVELFESSIILTSAAHTPSPALSVALRAGASSVGPFYRREDVLSIEDAKKRQSQIGGSALSVAELATLVDLAMFRSERKGCRPYPAAGGIYAIHVYFSVYNVEGLKSGVYYLRWADGTLELINSQEMAERFREYNVYQAQKESIPVIGLLVADTRLSQIKYHDRSWRMALIEAGALLQSLYLASSRTNIHISGLGAISDRAALSLCQIQPHEQSFFACGFTLGKGYEVKNTNDFVQ